MSCGYSKEILALYIESDLPTCEAMGKVETHVRDCAECRHYCEQLRISQSFIKSGSQSLEALSVTQEMLAGVRRGVMSQVDAVQQSLGWAVRLERFFILGLKTHRYAIAGFVFVAIISASLLAQMTHAPFKPGLSAAVFSGNDTLLCPSTYRDWVLVGCSLGKDDVVKHASENYHNVYIDPTAYREYTRSGAFPEGAVMVLEMFSEYDKGPSGLQVSVKDSSRFETGWGYFEFAASNGKLKAQAKVLPENAGCFACHRDRGRT